MHPESQPIGHSSSAVVPSYAPYPLNEIPKSLIYAITAMPYPQYLSSSSKSMIIGLERTASANVSIQKAVSCGAIYRSHHSSHRRYIITSKIHHGIYKYFRNCLCFLSGALHFTPPAAYYLRPYLYDIRETGEAPPRGSAHPIFFTSLLLSEMIHL